MTTDLTNTRFMIEAPARARVLVVATVDAADLSDILRAASHEVVLANTVEAGCAAIAEQRPDVVFVDPSAAETIVATSTDQSIPVIVFGGTPVAATGADGHMPTTAIEAAKLITELLLTRTHLQRSMETLEGLVTGVRDGSLLVGRSPVMRRLQAALSRAADSEATVLIEGASGSGKSTAARIIHCKSRRGDRPAIVRSASDLEGERFNAALVEARGSTLVLEDIDRLPMPGQQMLVRNLKERGGATGAETTRVIVTTSVHLPELVARGSFREDLYYRLHTYPITLPTLREHAEDIPLIADALLMQMAGTSAQRRPVLSPAARTAIESSPWPGNVAQMEGVLRRAFLAAAGSQIDDRHLHQSTALPAPVATVEVHADDKTELTEASIKPFDQEEQQLLSRALRATRGNVRRAAQLLGIGRATLYRKIQQYKLRLQ